jgi:hypothetical protein
MADEPIRDFDRWVILTLRLADGRLWLEYRDETGRRRGIRSDASGPDYSAWRPVLLQAESPRPPGIDKAIVNPRRRFQVFIPNELEQLLKEAWADFDDQRYHWTPEPVGHSETVPWLLPIFLSPPPGMEADPWEHDVDAFLHEQLGLPDRFVVMRLARDKWTVLPPFTLPLTIVDASAPSSDWLASIRNRNWYAREEAVRELGVKLEIPDSRREKRSPAHIVLERASGWPTLAHERLRGDPREPQLIVAFNDGPLDEIVSRSIGTLRRGTSLLIGQIAPRRSPFPQIHTPPIDATIMELVYTLVHDFALHEALWIIRRAQPDSYFLLSSDPAANQGLRLCRVMRKIVDETLALTLPFAGSDPSGALEQARREASDLAFDFSQESRGLTEMSRLLAGSIKRARSALKAIDVAFDADQRRQLALSQSRRADFALEEYSPFGALAPMREWIRKMPLRRAWRYRLRVHIGQQDAAFSAVQGEVPSIDSLLPHLDEDRGHDIDVVVFEKTFGILSPGVQTLHLPTFGGSKPVYFELRTPREPGRADLRIGLYCGNNLLQSFVLEAEIAPGLSRQEEATPQLYVRLASSGTTHFGNLDELRPRALSIALNDDVRGGTHTVMWKRGKLRESVTVTADQIKEHMDAFRAQLRKAIDAKDSKSARLFAADSPPMAERPDQFATYLREFARIGRSIWKSFLELSGVNTDALFALRRGRGETVQFVRHGKLLPFPWLTIYDYPLPAGSAFQNARVCFADTPVIREPGLSETGCPHHPGENFVCIEGFWSVRHCTEQVAEDRAETADPAQAPSGATRQQNRVMRIDVQNGSPLVWLGIGNDDLPALQLKNHLVGKLSTQDLRVLTDEDKPLEDLLWEATSRPGMLILLSHLEPADKQTNLSARVRAVVTKPPQPDNVVSEDGLLLRKLHLKEWGEPRSFVLLMACGSAEVHLKDLTNLVDTFFGVGAGAVAGTECDVISDLAVDFAKQITVDLTVGKQSLGGSLRAYTTRMLRAQNPLPFAFSVFGSAELTVGRAQS